MEPNRNGWKPEKKNKVDNIKDLLSLFKISFPETGKSQWNPVNVSKSSGIASNRMKPYCDETALNPIADFFFVERRFQRQRERFLLHGWLVGFVLFQRTGRLWRGRRFCRRIHWYGREICYHAYDNRSVIDNRSKGSRTNRFLYWAHYRFYFY